MTCSLLWKLTAWNWAFSQFICLFGTHRLKAFAQLPQTSLLVALTFDNQCLQKLAFQVNFPWPCYPDARFHRCVCRIMNIIREAWWSEAKLYILGAWGWGYYIPQLSTIILSFALVHSSLWEPSTNAELAKLATSQTKFCTSGGVSGNWGVSNWLWSTVHKHSPVPWITIILWEICQETSDNGTGQVQEKIWRERSKKHLMVSCIH